MPPFKCILDVVNMRGVGLTKPRNLTKDFQILAVSLFFLNACET